VGFGRASELLLTGDFVGAEEAQRIGLVTRVVAEGTLAEETSKLARRLADGPSFAHGMTKKMLEKEAHLDFDSAIEAEAQAQAICMQHADFREAYDAFVEKRKPNFS